MIAQIPRHVHKGQPLGVTRGPFQRITPGHVPEVIQSQGLEVCQDYAPEVTQGQVLEGIQSHGQETGIEVTQGHYLENGQGHLIGTIQGLVLEVSLDHFTNLDLGVATHIPEEEYILIRGQEAETGMIITMRGSDGTDLITTVQGLPAISLIGCEGVEGLQVGGEVHLLRVIEGGTGKRKTITEAESHLNHSVIGSER